MPNPENIRRPASDAEKFGRPETGWRLQLYRIVFEADTPAGKAFDVALLLLIVANIMVVMLDSIQALNSRYAVWFNALEWLFTAAFTVEYAARLLCVRRPLRYARSLFGVIDLIAVLPTYLGLFIPQAHALIDVRVLRLLRIFRILKMGAYVHEFQVLGQAVYASRRKIFVFLCFVMTVVVVMGTLMYVLEGPEHGFTSIPASIYWAIVTMTTVGFGDITPRTDVGRIVASIMMLLGWGTLAVPTGIVSAELTTRRTRDAPDDGTRTCQACRSTGHEDSARFCKDCGEALPTQASSATTGS